LYAGVIWDTRGAPVNLVSSIQVYNDSTGICVLFTLNSVLCTMHC